MSVETPHYVAFSVRGLALDPSNQAPILLLQDHAGRVLLPIWIGPAEAGAIAARLEPPEDYPRPMTHDLLQKCVAALEAEVLGVDIRALNEGTFYADLRLRRADGHELVLDCRPSDAIALALRVSAPIRVAAPVLEAAVPIPQSEQEARSAVVATDEVSRARLLESLADLDPEDFGQYEM